MHNSVALFIALNQIISGYYYFLLPSTLNAPLALIDCVRYPLLQQYLFERMKIVNCRSVRFLFEFLIKSPKGSKVRFLVQLFVDCVYQVFFALFFLSLSVLPITFLCSLPLLVSFPLTSFSLCSLPMLRIQLTPFFVKVNSLGKFLDLSESNSILNGNSLQMEMYNTQRKKFFETKIVKTQ